MSRDLTPTPQDDKAATKQLLLDLASAGAPRPRKDSYDPEFDRKLREIRPDWFN